MPKTIVITGGTGGIGLHTARGLAATGARLILSGRTRERGEAAVTQLRKETGNDAISLVLGDLSTRSGVAAVGDQILSATDRVDVLINNAGMLAQERIVTEDGFELDFAVNVMAPHTLTRHLLPVLKAAAPARVLMLTGGKPSGAFSPVDLQSREGFVPLVNYTRTKRAEESMSLVLAEELAPEGVFVTVVYPGRASTAMTRAMTPSSLPWFMRPAWPIFRFLIPREDGGKSAEKASRSSVFAATTALLEGKAGTYIDMNSAVGALHPTVHDPGNQQIVMAELDNPSS